MSTKRYVLIGIIIFLLLGTTSAIFHNHKLQQNNLAVLKTISATLYLTKTNQIGSYHISNPYTNRYTEIYTSTISQNEFEYNLKQLTGGAFSLKRDNKSDKNNYIYSGGIFLENGSYPDVKRLIYKTEQSNTIDSKDVDVREYALKAYDNNISIQVVSILHKDGYWQLNNRKIKEDIVIINLNKQPTGLFSL